ncbi:hypothetical protein FJZ19_00465 [Candidatus Pacearchaeota archaeon]|nr:hypothetical protein [Candidatus Pacearchaeota archaeon]
MSKVPADVSIVSYGSQLSIAEVFHGRVYRDPPTEIQVSSESPIARELNRQARRDLGRTLRFVTVNGREYRVYEKGKAPNTAIFAALAYNPSGDAKVYRVQCRKEEDLGDGLARLTTQLREEDARKARMRKQ